MEAWFPVGNISRWWRGRIDASLADCGDEEVEHMAHDLCMSTSELRELARKEPNSADLLLRRMASIDLDPKEVSLTQRATFQDLQRLCTRCRCRRRCARDLACEPNSPAWKDYCPNAGTLNVLDALPWAARGEW
jgi:hypothetical protein